MSNKVFDLSLYLVLDPVLTEKLGMVRTAELAVQGGEQRRDRRRACALVAPKANEHRIGSAGTLRLARNLICIHIIAQRGSVNKLDACSL